MVTSVLMIETSLLTVFMNRLSIIALGVSINGIHFMTILVMNLMFFNNRFTFLYRHYGHVVRHSIRRGKVNELPITHPVERTSILGLIVFGNKSFLTIIVIIVILYFLRALSRFFNLSTITGSVRRISSLRILINNVFRDVIRPTIKLATRVSRRITIKSFSGIVNDKLVTIRIGTIVGRRHSFNIVNFIAWGLARPIVFKRGNNSGTRFINFINVILLSTTDGDTSRRRGHGRRHDCFFVKFIASES